MRDELDHGCGKMFKNRSIIVDILAILFGIGTWVGVNATFIQLPLLVEEAPESWSLPSYLSVMVQFGNLGPLAYTLLQKCTKNNQSDDSLIYGLLSIGTLSILLTAFFYNQTSIIFGSEHSLALFILTFFTALNACTSSVLFMPYMGRFKEVYLVTFFVGEGLSGMLPSVVALVQGIGGESQCILVNATESGEATYEKYTAPPRFGSMAFFLSVFGIMVCSFIGFALLNRLKLAKMQYANVQISYSNSYYYERKEMDGATSESADLCPSISSSQYWALLLLIGVISCFSNGMFNSIQSYSSLPYGSNAYHLSATLSVMANPVACFLAIFLPHTSLRSIITLTGISSVLTTYVFVTAAMSPEPPMHNTTAGAVIVIITWTLLIGCVSYIKLSITTVMRSQGGKSLVWTGGLVQLGSLFGSLLIFALINFTNSFKSSTSDDDTC